MAPFVPTCHHEPMTYGRALRARAVPAVLIAASVVLVLLAVALASTSFVLSAVAIAMAAAVGAVAHHEITEGARDREGLRLDEIDRLRRAEVALAAAPSTEV